MPRRPRREPCAGGMSRREFVRASLGLLGTITVSASGAFAGGATQMRTRKIPSTGEALPILGLGTWQTFDVGDSPAERRPLAEVLRRLFAAGGRLIDSSPMYGRSEAVVGELLRRGRYGVKPFLATKVWTIGRAEGIEQMENSERKMGGIDLMQVHNLVDWPTHLPTLRAWKESGRIRYIGITHYSTGAFEEMERIVRHERVDFVQLPYSLGMRDAEQRLLPAAAESGTSVIVMRPFEAGSLFEEVRGKALPPWSAEIGCRSWAQVFLKFILSHPAVTAAIPATRNPAHLEDDLGAASGPMPDAGMRRRMVAALTG